MELWYTQPAVDWNAALPAGNGRLGCMQFGGVARERFQLNEDSLWSGGPMHRLNPDASATLPKVQELLRQGRLPDAERLALDGLASTPCGMRAYQPLGDLTLDFDGLPAEVMLELRFGGDDVFFPAVGIFEMPAERAVQPLRAALLEHPLAIGRVADEKALVRGQAHLRGVRLTELDELADARLARVLLRDLE